MRFYGHGVHPIWQRQLNRDGDMARGCFSTAARQRQNGFNCFWGGNPFWARKCVDDGFRDPGALRPPKSQLSRSDCQVSLVFQGVLGPADGRDEGGRHPIGVGVGTGPPVFQVAIALHGDGMGYPDLIWARRNRQRALTILDRASRLRPCRPRMQEIVCSPAFRRAMPNAT